MKMLFDDVPFSTIRDLIPKEKLQVIAPGTFLRDSLAWFLF